MSPFGWVGEEFMNSLFYIQLKFTSFRIIHPAEKHLKTLSKILKKLCS